MKCFNYLSAFTGICFLSLGMVSPATATPVIGIGSMYDVLMPGTQSMTKRIYNTGDSTAFVRVGILEIHPGNNTNPEEKPQKEVSGKTLEQDRLIVTPQRLIIPPGGFQAVRLLWPGSRDTERYFRVRFTPVMPEADDSFGLNKEAASEYRKNTLHAGLNVLTGYGTIVIVQPEKPVFNSEINKLPSGDIMVRNKGNATISLDNIRQCKSVNTDCGATTREFILPGKSQTVKNKAGYKTNFTLIEGNNQRALNY